MKTVVLPSLGRWSDKGGVFLRWKRIYHQGHKWTPLCSVSWRSTKILEPAGDEFKYYKGKKPNGGTMVERVRGIPDKRRKWLGGLIIVGVMTSLLFISMKAYQLLWAPEPTVIYQVTYHSPSGERHIYTLKSDQIKIRSNGWVEIEPDGQGQILLRGDVLVIVKKTDWRDE